MHMRQARGLSAPYEEFSPIAFRGIVWLQHCRCRAFVVGLTRRSHFTYRLSSTVENVCAEAATKTATMCAVEISSVTFIFAVWRPCADRIHTHTRNVRGDPLTPLHGLHVVAHPHRPPFHRRRRLGHLVTYATTLYYFFGGIERAVRNLLCPSRCAFRLL